MGAVEILSQKTVSKYSKPFKVDVGRAVIISSFNFACPTTDEVGEVIKPGDCAVLHKIELSGDELQQIEGCVSCSGCTLDGLKYRITSNEPVVQCGETWTHSHECNLSVLTVPGYYMFEVCNEGSLGSLSIKVEDVSLAEAALIPTNLIHGS